jgi:hypothetical protein
LTGEIVSGAQNPFAEFGEFRLLFEGTPEHLPGYLPLLNLGGVPAVDAVRQLLQAIDASGANLRFSICALLSGYGGWRPQLVGAAAAVAVGPDADCIEALWDALDHSCWTSPQLAAAASRVDRSFLVNARSRLDRRCHVGAPASMLARMSPSTTRDRLAEGRADPKLMAAFVALYREQAPEESWLSALLERPDVAGLLSEDRDRGGEIALHWLRRLDEVLAHVRSMAL